jgi:DNA repair exonuclease SbcCD ATPase subunit
VTDLRVEEDGSVVGEAELLDTARGKDLKAIITSGCTLGVSSRGYGSTETTEGGQERVSSDYRLETFDFVCNPADVTAYPEQIESVDAPEERPVVLAESSNKFAEALAVETARVASELRAEFTEKLPVLLAKVKAEALAEAEENFRSGTTDYSNAVSQIKDLLSDAVQAVPSAPNLDASVSELSLKIEELCGEVDRLRDERDRALTLARTTGHKYFLEKKLSGDSDAEFIRNALGDVGRYENLASLGDRLDAIQAQLAERRAQQAEEARQKEAAERLKIEEIESRVRAEREKSQAKIETVQRLAESQQAREAELTSVVSQLEEEGGDHG